MDAIRCYGRDRGKECSDNDNRKHTVLFYFLSFFEDVFSQRLMDWLFGLPGAGMARRNLYGSLARAYRGFIRCIYMPRCPEFDIKKA